MSVFDKTVPSVTLDPRVVFLGVCSPDTILNVSTTELVKPSLVNSEDGITVEMLPERSKLQVLILYIRFSDGVLVAIPVFCGTYRDPLAG